MHEDLIAAVDDLFPSLRATLESLVRIPSVSADGHDPAEVRRSAAAVAELLEDAGLDGVRLLEIPGAHPAIFGELPAAEGKPTVLLYAHHDVQPAGPIEQWKHPPFEPTEVDGRLYGRGASDDKAGIVVHLGAIQALAASRQVGIKVFIEGEEEIGSEHLGAFLSTYRDVLAAEVIVIADSGNIEIGVPTLTTSLRGLAECDVEVRVLDDAVHSGVFGGAVPDALMTLSRLLASLHHDDGSVAVAGLTTATLADVELDETDFRENAGMVAGVELIGSGSIADRIWAKPAISILAIDAPRVGDTINQIIPVARATVSLRTAPGEDTQQAVQALARHLESNVPWGAQVTVRPGGHGDAHHLDTTDPAYDAFRTGFSVAWETETVEVGIGGSIPFVAAFSELFPEAPIILTGVGDPSSRWHGPNESQDLVELRRGVLAEAIALRLLAEIGT